jgi:hypothetical protein
MLYMIGGVSLHNQQLATQRMYAQYVAWKSAGFSATTTTHQPTTTTTQ